MKKIRVYIMCKYIKYLNYVLRHKWFVFIECCKLGIPFLGLIHDMSKFTLREFLPYAHYFYGEGEIIVRDKTGYYKPTDTGNNQFDTAWFYHSARNKHHWQYWIVPEHPNKLIPVEMPEIYVKEMLADWKGAGRAQGNPNTLAWYCAHRDDLVLHPNTKAYVDAFMGFEKVQTVSLD